jgi:flagellar biosynthetic protein FliS
MLSLKRYGEVRSTTASREQLLALLLEAALANIRAGRAALDENRPFEASKPLLKATQIVSQLMATLDRRVAPRLAENIGKVYAFVCQRLLVASTKRDPRAAEEAERSFTPVAEGLLEAIRRETTAAQ